LFTDPEAAARAQARGYEVGPCAGGVAGTELFSDLDPRWAEIHVNLGCPPEEAFYYQPHKEHGYLLCNKIADAVRLEKAIAGYGESRPDQVIELLWGQKELFVVQVADGSLLTGYNEDRTYAALLVFTGPDKINQHRLLMTDQSLLEGSQMIVLNGEQVFEALEVFGYRAMVINVAGPGTGYEVKSIEK
jgi:hypothetical protein